MSIFELPKATSRAIICTRKWILFAGEWLFFLQFSDRKPCLQQGAKRILSCQKRRLVQSFAHENELYLQANDSFFFSDFPIANRAFNKGLKEYWKMRDYCLTFFFPAWAWLQSGVNTDGAHNFPTTRRVQKGDILSLNCFPMIAGYVITRFSQ